MLPSSLSVFKNIMDEITLSGLTSILKTGESEIIEFKESFNDEALESIGAFMNAKGGTLFLGIRNSGEVCGFNIGKKTLEDIANRIQESTDPRIQPSISTINFEKKVIIIISLSVGLVAPVSVRGRYFRRVGKSNQRMSHEEIMQRMISNSGISWDAAIEQNASLADLNFDKIKHFVDMVKVVGRKPIPEGVSNLDFLKKIDLIKEDKPTRASILLFGNNPQSYFSSAFLKLGRFRSPLLILDDREIHNTLISQLDGAVAWFKERLETEFIITGNPQREVKWEYPLSAIRESIINLLCHRDYMSHAHSQIRLYDDRLEFWNAGGLPLALTPELLFTEHDSIPRNRQLAEAFFYIGLIERWGSGTTRIASELQLNEHPLPLFKSESGKFRVIFFKNLYSDELLKNRELTKRQCAAIAYIKENGKISNSEYQNLTGASKRTASRELKDLVVKNIIITEGFKGQGVIYQLKPL